MKSKRYLHLALLLPVLLLGPLACESIDTHPRTAAGAGIGTAAGALAGGIIGHQSGNTATGAVIGGLSGAALGGGIGYAMDRQQRKLQQIRDVEVVRAPRAPDPATGRIEPEHLVLRMSSQLLFERGSSALSPQGTQKVREIAQALNESPDAVVVVKGYASAEGSDLSAMALSERRAAMVKNTLVATGVPPDRVTALGLGESNPIASSEMAAGRAENRRVEIEVYPPARGGSAPPPPPPDDRYTPPPSVNRSGY